VFSGRVGELLNGTPARVWDFTDPSEPSRWSERSLSLFVGDRVAIAPRVTVDGGLRFETIAGSAAAHDGTIGWTSLLPRAGIHWTMLNFWELGAFGSYARYGHRLPLTDLAYGEPDGADRQHLPVECVDRRRAAGEPDRPAGAAPGPGHRRRRRFPPRSNPALKRPHMDEAVLGFDARPSPRTFLRIAAIGRREKDNVAVADVGVPESSDSTIAGAGHRHRRRRHAGRSAPDFYKPLAGDFRRRSVSADQPGRRRGIVVGADMIGQVHTEKVLLLPRVSPRGRAEGIAAEPRLRTARERHRR